MENEVVTFSAWLCLMRNAQKEKGLVPYELMVERIDWYYSEADKHGGQFPSTRDITEHYKKNGVKKEWEQLWKSVVRLAKKLKELDDTPNLLRQALYEILRVELD